MPYYILSVKHTRAEDKYFTLWKPNDHGYCQAKEAAGVYHQLKKGYHGDESNIPIPLEAAEELFLKVGSLHVIPNVRRVRKELGLRIKEGSIVKI